MKNKINIYVCSNCNKRTITIDKDDGTTPFMASCPECKSIAFSSFYNVDQDLIPTHEWYRPEEKELENLDEETQEYVNNGGLLLRRIK